MGPVQAPLLMQTADEMLFSVNSGSHDLSRLDYRRCGGIRNQRWARPLAFLQGGISKGYKIFRINIVDFPQAIAIGDSVLAVNV